VVVAVAAEVRPWYVPDSLTVVAPLSPASHHSQLVAAVAAASVQIYLHHYYYYYSWRMNL
jgi:hypothetical protein